MAVTALIFILNLLDISIEARERKFMLKKNQALKFPTLVIIQSLSVPFYLNRQEQFKPYPLGVCSNDESLWHSKLNLNILLAFHALKFQSWQFSSQLLEMVPCLCFPRDEADGS